MTGSKAKEDGGALGRAAENISRYKTGTEKTETKRQLYISGWSGLRAGARAGRKVGGVMGSRHIPRKLKWKVLSSCITSAYRE